MGGNALVKAEHQTDRQRQDRDGGQQRAAEEPSALADIFRLNLKLLIPTVFTQVKRWLNALFAVRLFLKKQFR